MYVSNRSDQDVFFDNLKVQVQGGNIIEENHYYAYGLKIAPISSVKLGDGGEGGLQNNYEYQGKYSELDADINWHDFELRNYDPQIGRWVQQDPYQEYPSPYLGMGNDPINLIDKTGGIVGIPCPGTSAFSLFLQSVGSAIRSAITAIQPFANIASIGVHITSTAVNIKNSIDVSNIINTSVESIQVGGQAGGADPLTIPIFWEEEGFPDIEHIDKNYYDNYAPPNQKIDVGGAYVFLLLHSAKNSTQSKKNRYLSKQAYEDSDNYVTNPNGSIFHRHEVPYASTVEGGANSYSELASAKQNRDHGNALEAFYNRYNLKAGDWFLVPLKRGTKEQIKPKPLFLPLPIKAAEEAAEREALKKAAEQEALQEEIEAEDEIIVEILEWLL